MVRRRSSRRQQGRRGRWSGFDDGALDDDEIEFVDNGRSREPVGNLRGEFLHIRELDIGGIKLVVIVDGRRLHDGSIEDEVE